MFDPPVEISYRTTKPVRRTGPFGKGLRWLGDHPVLGGFLCGVAVVIIAAIRSPAGVAADPITAGLISAAVVVVWMVLFFLMRRFFEAQSYVDQKVLRRLVVGEESATWFENEEPTVDIKNPRVRILTNPVPEGLVDDESERSGQTTAWPIWIVIDSEDADEGDHLVFETRDSASQARDFDEITDDFLEDTDERLPRAIASPILQRL